ncbi:hydroxymethylglutaryl-CoA synthase (plasmid) [Paucilactobacillus suebicus]|uniref:Hydroxymethylglutaryl-CoA synthase n=1 Tax=Paucilactobacillus suebicus DSM 5007 = KCTC 3549 TaxID=1423807 RepID=A0A0R1W3A4_9LACO|nr:hydroxymethylglutaryl-CoA synthase [Paucilactobacillus suebicus]KRM08924.1 hydroxymethylglutaryl-CoA synthase [Paucilactobacillus suebicus DSM 5007 = KCTC 3549]
MQIGIDKIGFYTPSLYLDLVDLAHARNEEPDKYLIGIGQEKQAVIPATQDIVTMGASAADQILTEEDKKDISTVIVATESGVDNSKAAAIYVKQLLGLDNFVRTVELKEACYSGTAAIQFARGLVNLNDKEKVLVITADIARYGIGTPGEVTQGGGAIAMLISVNPRVLAIENQSVSYTDDIMDFWRPLYRSEALVDGKYSTNVYIDFFNKCWNRYSEITDRSFDDFSALIFHLPFTKMGKKALDSVMEKEPENIANHFGTQLKFSQQLSRQVGNLYTGSLYMSFLSLLQFNSELVAGNRIGLFSYGSGAEGEFYSGILQNEYGDVIDFENIETMLNNRTKVSVADYETIFNSQIGYTSTDVVLDTSNDKSKYVLSGQKDQQRQYFVRK